MLLLILATISSILSTYYISINNPVLLNAKFVGNNLDKKVNGVYSNTVFSSQQVEILKVSILDYIQSITFISEIALW